MTNSPDLNPLDYHVWRAMLERYKTFQSKPNTADELKKVLPSHRAAAMPGAMVVPLSPTRVMQGGASTPAQHPVYLISFTLAVFDLHCEIYFSFSAENGRCFSFMFIFRPKKKIYFSAIFILRPKK